MKFWLFWLVVFFASVFFTEAAEAQTTACHGRPITVLDFRNPVLISGTALSAGAVYRFPNVTTGVDARVTVVALNGATLATIDRDTGLIGNFQPELGGANARSIDFTISFVTAGGTAPVSLDVAASGIDIDGDSGSLREYAEFSKPFASYVLENPTNLDVNFSGPSVPSNVRFESRTNFTASGIDPTATQNIVSVQYTGTSSFNYRIGALGTGSTIRLTSLDFSCPVMAFPTPAPQSSQDFGDAVLGYGNPAHDIVAGILLGSVNTTETSSYNSPTAVGDTGDDGVTFSAMTQGQSTTHTSLVSGSGGRLQAWVDWNGDGDFADAGEQIATNIQDNGPGDTNPSIGSIGLAINVPITATTNPTIARFRWSTQSNLGAAQIASNGEVEDYQVTIAGTAIYAVSKTSTILDNTGLGGFAIPGNDVVYTITVTNTGAAQSDTDSTFVLDSLPPEVEFFNGDIDGAGPATGAVYFTQNGASLSFSEATDLKYSDSVSPPALFTNCTYVPAAGYDPLVRHVCLNPKGAMSAGDPAPSFTLQLRARIE
ncbi:MAG: GEVED domain-containing protein [Parasphingorhabdus sp.]